ncbi:PQQ-dependent sugar dehydrogenase [Halomonas sp. 18H]|uniref:PQQ-dependent sugar dehydrogenase n=1 Tax=Halomonas almeriensis TaxID=308163 RepID=UPI00222EA9C9|nr:MULTISPECIES: PQQ-dependent sugar dehydrogenase [Halomonas]MCW4149331.1 PQQ-dependent sugar dehydrogenase [Halomonas sp. 18H]MDN3553723.1 PQQ-dependent sugar dehydrogenase [Halomonas almeriensis]
MPAFRSPLLASLLWCASFGAEAASVIETRQLTLCLEPIATGFEHPWSLAQLPDGRFLISERSGQLKLVTAGGDATRLSGVPEVSARGQGGLLDVSLHPRFASDDNGQADWVYFTWSRAGEGGSATSLSRARLEDQRLTGLQHLFTQNRFSPPGRHYGSRLAWREDETLLMSIGDRGLEPDRAQDGRDHAGSILRLDPLGQPPGDNPFIDDPRRADAIYTLGNRNPQGLVVAEDGSAWSTEHGPRTGDEFNHLVAGANYGWPVVSLGRDYATNEPIGLDSAPGMREPRYVFEGRFAPSGLAQVTSERFDAWHGDFVAGGLSSQKLVRLSRGATDGVAREVILDGDIGRIRDVRQGHDGALYLLNDSPTGSLFRLLPLDSAPQAGTGCPVPDTKTKNN